MQLLPKYNYPVLCEMLAGLSCWPTAVSPSGRESEQVWCHIIWHHVDVSDTRCHFKRQLVFSFALAEPLVNTVNALLIQLSKHRRWVLEATESLCSLINCADQIPADCGAVSDAHGDTYAYVPDQGATGKSATSRNDLISLN